MDGILLTHLTRLLQRLLEGGGAQGPVTANVRLLHLLPMELKPEPLSKFL